MLPVELFTNARKIGMRMPERRPAMIKKSLLDFPEDVENLETEFQQKIVEIRTFQTEEEHRYVIRLLQARESWEIAGTKGELSGRVLRLYRQIYTPNLFTDTAAAPDTEWIKEVTAFVLTDYILHGDHGIFDQRFVFLMLHEIAHPRQSLVPPVLTDALVTARTVVEKIPSIDDVLTRLIKRMHQVYTELQYGASDQIAAAFLIKMGKALGVDPRPLRIKHAVGELLAEAPWRQEISQRAQAAVKRLENTADLKSAKATAL